MHTAIDAGDHKDVLSGRCEPFPSQPPTGSSLSPTCVCPGTRVLWLLVIRADSIPRASCSLGVCYACACLVNERVKVPPPSSPISMRLATQRGHESLYRWRSRLHERVRAVLAPFRDHGGFRHRLNASNVFGTNLPRHNVSYQHRWAGAHCSIVQVRLSSCRLIGSCEATNQPSVRRAPVARERHRVRSGALLVW